VVVTPVAVEIWMPSWWNDRGHIGLGRGSRAPVDYARSRLSYQREWVPRLGPPGAPRLARGLHASLGRGGSMPRGSSALMTSRGLGRDEKMAPEAPISPETFPQGSGGMEFVVRATSDWHAVSNFGRSVLLGLLRWSFSNHAGCRILSSVGYPGILIPDSSPRACGGVEHSFRGLRRVTVGSF
jgi:hypothetical protein